MCARVGALLTAFAARATVVSFSVAGAVVAAGSEEPPPSPEEPPPLSASPPGELPLRLHMKWRWPSAVRQAAIGNPELVLMEIKLANNSDGIETAKLMRTRTPVAVIFVSAYLDCGTRQRAALPQSRWLPAQAVFAQ
jgi:hypothetical protein